MPCPVLALKLSAGAPSSGAVAPESHLENARMSASAICCRYSHATSASAPAACSAPYCAASTSTVNGASRNKWAYSCSNGRFSQVAEAFFACSALPVSSGHLGAIGDIPGAVLLENRRELVAHMH